MKTSLKKELRVEFDAIRTRFKNQSRSEQTPAIKRAVAKVFTDTDYQVYTNKLKDYAVGPLITENREFLYDLTVLKMRSIGEEVFDYLTETTLVMESELNTDLKSVMDDFQKLLMSNARFKVMVYQCSTEKHGTWVAAMEKSIGKYTNANGRFYLVGYINDEEEFDIIEVK